MSQLTFDLLPEPIYPPCEFKVVALRECPLPENLHLADTPAAAAAYWSLHVPTAPYFNADIETAIVLMLTTKRRVKGHALVTMGTLDSAMVHSREVFRAAIVSAASAVILMHNHPSGDPTPSDADIRISRDLHRAGQLLKIDLLDSIVVGAAGRFASLRELGHFYF